MTRSASRILIIGGGFSGMAAAIQLRQQGAEVDLVEIDPGWRSYGAGISLGGATLRAFRPFPDLLPRKAEGTQRTTPGELRKAHRDAAADGLAAVVRGERAEVQTLAASRRRPRQHLAAEQAEHRAGAVGDGQAQRRDARELDMFDAGDGHRAQSCKASTPSFTVLSSGSLLSTKPSFCTNLSMRSLFDRNTPFM